MRGLLVAALLGSACGVPAKGPPDAAIDAPSDGPGDAPVDAGTAQPSLDPPVRDFRNICVGDSATRDVTITNTGSAAEPILFAVTGTNAADFTIETTSCTTLAPTNTCSATVRFRPLTAGAKSAVLSAVVPSGASASATLAGSASACTSLVPSPTALSLGMVTVGSVSAAKTITIANVSNTITTPAFVAPTLTGPAPTDFEIVGDTCAGVSLAPGAQCMLDIRFHPQALGARAATVNLSASGGPTVFISLSGYGLSQVQLSASPTICDFGGACISAATECTVTIANSGVAGDAVTFAITGSDAALFSVHDTTCGQPVAPGSSCSATLRFKPTTPGVASAVLNASAMGSTTTSALSGTGLSCSTLVRSPPSLTFSTTPIGAASASQTLTLTLTNPSGSPSAPIALALGGAHPGDFAIVSDACSGASLGPQMQCTLAVEFHPTAAGTRSAELDVRAGAGGIVTEPLSGDGAAALGTP